MHNTEQTIEPAAELKQIAEQIHDIQTRLGLSDSALCKKYADLGSTKTYSRILSGDTEEMNVERQLHNYRQALIKVQMSAATDNQFDESTFSDFSDPTRVRIAVSEAMAQPDNTRLVIVTGESGKGKTAIKEMLCAKWPKATVAAEADENWKDSLPAFLADMIIAVNPIERGDGRSDEEESTSSKTKSGEILIPFNTFERKHKLLTALRRRKLCLFIDEGHHLGIRAYNFVKTIINKTETVVVIFADPVLFKNFELSAYRETSQLTHNRLYERIRLAGPTPSEVAVYMQRKQVSFADEKDIPRFAKQLADDSHGRGEWKVVKLVTKKLRKAKGPIDQEQFVEALNAVIRTR
jgi:DNA transposition AAA+ family ATPase